MNRYKIAHKFGSAEHKISRLLGYLLFIEASIALLSPESLRFELFEIGIWRYLFIVDLILWILYWVSHRLEKKFYPTKR